MFILDPCDYDPANQDYTITTMEFQDADCDGDGVTNGDEIDPDGNGTDDGNGTNPLDPCDYDPALQDLANVTAEWNDLDCDGDGVSNGQEILDGTDPLDNCDYDPANQDYTITTMDYQDGDCDGDGVTNGDEIDPDGNGIDDGNGTDPFDLCDYDPALQDYTITTMEFQDADCDGDGVTNGDLVITIQHCKTWRM